MSLEAMVTAAREGKITDFESAFKTTMAQRVMSRIEDTKHELGQSIKVDGEYTTSKER